VDNRDEVREFLVSRRARLSPEQAGVPAGSRRRVPGLRRSEVAALADVSVEYYAKLERGSLSGVSPAVLEAVAITAGPAWVANGRLDVLAANALARAFYTDFRTRWGAHNVTRHGTGTKRFQHPVVGELTLSWEALAMTSESGLTLTVYTAEPGSPSEESLQLLASWAASRDDASETQAI
jgi:hypothetical protein